MGEHAEDSTPLRRRLSLELRRALRAARRELLKPLAALLAVVLVQQSAALAPGLVERFYARSFYPPVARTLSRLTGGLAFSAGEALFVLFCLLLLSALALFVYRLARRRGEWRALLLKSCRLTLWCAAASVFVFMLVFGLNYQRPPLVETLGYDQRRATADELDAMTRAVVEGVNRNYDESHAEGYTTPDTPRVVRILEESYAGEAELSNFAVEGFGPPKPVYFSDALTRLGISGVYFPFTGEPNFNADAPDFERPFSIAHEMAHQRGFARESEANFVAFLVCAHAADPFVRYSGYRQGFGVAFELYKLDAERARAILKGLNSGYREDSQLSARFWLKAGGTAGDLSRRLNDLYLKANRIKSGTKNYGEVTALLIGYYLRRPPSTP
ncbi:MAG TPA: DUF3810 domain-containing protein [Pyrinomonadaceae bacterium]|jgi:hypothetical protein|nr:DUF3810 domain-containing protein [Pyrinomonadaceae bacterium]